MSTIKKIGVLTSGGDAPGMNAAIRAVVRAALYRNLEVVGIRKGYKGMISGDFIPLISKDVSNIIQRGGTILGTARSDEFRTPEGRQKAYGNLIGAGINACIVIGGDGSFQGAGIFSKEYDIPFIGIPGTIDNDLFGTDYTIGYDTALNTVVEAVDRIRDTASAHDRMFFIEVMGRGAGFIALHSGIATGAEAILIPEVDGQEESLHEYLQSQGNKSSNIILVAEGNQVGGAEEIASQIKNKYPDYDVRVNILGHMQRGGSPSAFDRFLASRLGVAAVEALMDNQRSIMVGFVNHDIVHVPFNKTINASKNLNKILLDVADILAH
ncbi:MAG: 6-phosphofructokinase [Bacteroidetes bacterium GWF2_49_14]|nr:MAG: 6-phosphofructokinase [Bacteroidetes bacterium GWF2_49_14]HBB90296.1 6-phosphofructokinase [Bacteroidales bacterium]